MSTTATKHSFTADGETSYVGYTFGQKWNGFECPAFEKDVALQLIADLNAQEDVLTGRYDPTTGNIIIVDTSYPDEPGEVHEPYTINTADGEKTVYAIGSHEWAWEIDADL